MKKRLLSLLLITLFFNLRGAVTLNRFSDVRLAEELKKREALCKSRARKKLAYGLLAGGGVAAIGVGLIYYLVKDSGGGFKGKKSKSKNSYYKKKYYKNKCKKMSGSFFGRVSGKLKSALITGVGLSIAWAIIDKAKDIFGSGASFFKENIFVSQDVFESEILPLSQSLKQSFFWIERAINDIEMFRDDRFIYTNYVKELARVFNEAVSTMERLSAILLKESSKEEEFWSQCHIDKLKLVSEQATDAFEKDLNQDYEDLGDEGVFSEDVFKSFEGLVRASLFLMPTLQD